MPVNLLATPHGRRWLFALLYLSEGAPVGFVWWAMPTLLRGQGVELAAITTLTSLATIPWVLKFLAAPFVDAGVARGVPLTRWIAVCQVAMTLALVPLALLDWSMRFELVVAAVVLHALFAAMQDVGIDALAIHTVPRAELGRVNGWMQAGMLLGRAGIAGGAALLVARFGGPAAAVLCLAVLILVPLVVLLAASREPRIEALPPRPRAVAGALLTRAGLAGLAIALVAGAGFEFFGVSAGPRLIDLGAADGSVALFFGVLAPAGLAAGALAGGTLADRVGAARATALGLVALTAVLGAIGIDALTGPVLPALPAFAVAYVGIGLLTASSYALFMSLSRGDFAATRFSFLMAMTNACEAWSGFVGGRFAGRSYGATLLVLALFACIALWPLRRLARRPAAA